MLRGCYEDISDFQTISKSVWRVAITCPQKIVRAGLVKYREIWSTTRQKDKRAALPQQTAGRNRYDEVVNILVTCYEDVTGELTRSYAFATTKLRGNCPRGI